MSERGEHEGPFDELFKIFGSLRSGPGSQPISLATARMTATELATGGVPEPNVEPTRRMELEEVGRAAALEAATALGIERAAGVRVVCGTRAQWVDRVLGDIGTFVRSLAEHLVQSVGEPEPHHSDGGDTEALLRGWLRMMAPVQLGAMVGGTVGRVARRAFGDADLYLPRRVSTELMLVAANIGEFGRAWSIPEPDLHYWVCLEQICTYAIVQLEHVSEVMRDGIGSSLVRFRMAGAERLADRLARHLQDFDPDDVEGWRELSLRVSDASSILEGPLGPEPPEVTRMRAVRAAIAGHVDWVVEKVIKRMIPGWARIDEAAKRRLIEHTPEHLTATVLGVQPTRDDLAAGRSFVEGILDRTDESALRKLWSSRDALPTPAEIEAPGLWIARMELRHSD